MNGQRILKLGGVFLLFVLFGYVQAQWTEDVKLTPSDGGPREVFGSAVSLSGATAVVGSHQDNDKGTWSGSVFVYEHNGSTWKQAAKLTAFDGASGDYFGKSVSVDGNTVVVGSYYDDDNGTNSGSAYVFQRDGLTWNHTAKLTAADGAERDYFGHTVATSGNYLVVGARGDDDNGTSSGSAYVFERNGSTWNQMAKLTASDGGPAQSFGRSASISGDQIIIGQSYSDDDIILPESAYVFQGSGTSWNEIARLFASDGNAHDGFGASVSIFDDYAIIGAPGDDDGATDSGSAYVFKRNGSTWSEVAKLIASDSQTRAYFGCSVSIGNENAVVGAAGYIDGNNFSSAYVFERDGVDWSQVAKLSPSDGGGGNSVSISGDFILVGDPADEDNGTWSGSAYIYRIPELGTLLGDMDGSGKVDSDDINPFILALMDPNAYVAQHGMDPNAAGDIDGSGTLNTDDINPFISLILGGASGRRSVPEPATLSLLTLGTLALIPCRRK